MFVSLRPVELTDDCRQIHSNIHQILLTQIVKCFIEYGIVDIKLAAGGNWWPVGRSSFSSLYFLFSLSLVLFA